MSKTLCFGGSFNPIHHGHLICAQAAAEAGKFDQVLLIPSANPPHKPASLELAKPSDRLAMCRLAVEGNAAFAVDAIEIERGGASYTLDTARQLRLRGLSEIHWLIGADMLQQLPSWHKPNSLLAEVQFHILLRPGYTIDWPALPASLRPLEEYVLPAPQIDISATAIRDRVRRGLSIAYLTPETVVRYIRENKMYIGEEGTQARRHEGTK